MNVIRAFLHAKMAKREKKNDRYSARTSYIVQVCACVWSFTNINEGDYRLLPFEAYSIVSCIKYCRITIAALLIRYLRALLFDGISRKSQMLPTDTFASYGARKIRVRRNALNRPGGPSRHTVTVT